MKEAPTPRYNKLKANGRAGNVRFLSMRPKLTRGLHNQPTVSPVTALFLEVLTLPPATDATP